MRKYNILVQFLQELLEECFTMQLDRPNIIDKPEPYNGLYRAVENILVSTTCIAYMWGHAGTNGCARDLKIYL
jgi:hypothetical protein